MCIGEMGLDTIGEAERAALRIAARQNFPRHVFGIHANAEGLIWVVLEPPAVRADLLRVTICRIVPCLMVMTEDASGRRQIASTEDLDGAMAFARTAAGLASGALHAPHDRVQ